MLRCDPRKGMYVACSMLYRGDVNVFDVKDAIALLKSKESIRFVDWCKNCYKVLTIITNKMYHAGISTIPNSVWRIKFSLLALACYVQNNYRLLKKNIFQLQRTVIFFNIVPLFIVSHILDNN